MGELHTTIEQANRLALLNEELVIAPNDSGIGSFHQGAYAALCCTNRDDFLDAYDVSDAKRNNYVEVVEVTSTLRFFQAPDEDDSPTLTICIASIVCPSWRWSTFPSRRTTVP